MDNYQYIKNDLIESIKKASTDISLFNIVEPVLSKKNLCMWAIAKVNQKIYENFSPYVVFCTNFPNGFTNISSSIFLKELFEYIDAISSPSKLSLWLEIFYNNRDIKNVLLGEFHFDRNISEIQSKNEFYLIQRKYLILPEFEIKTFPITLPDGSQPPLAVVNTLNMIDPIFTGFFLENLFYLSYKFQLSNFTEKNNEIVINKDLINLFKKSLTTNFSLETDFSIDKSSSIPMNKYDIEYIKNVFNRLLTEDKNNNCILLYYNLYISFKQLIKKQLNTNHYTVLFKFIEFLSNKINSQALMIYFLNLAKTALIKSFRKFKDLKTHGIEKIINLNSENNPDNQLIKYLSGEIDFLFPNMILDTKAYKSNPITQWAGQLYLYSLLNNNLSSRYLIFNFLNNNIVEYKFK